jgi:phosphoribosylamine-glycine ligase
VSSSPLFEWLCSEIATRTTLGLPQSRGTVRLALKDAGIELRTLNKGQALVIIDRVLPHELQLRGVGNAATLCAGISQALRALTLQQTGPDSAEAIFERLGRN